MAARKTPTSSRSRKDDPLADYSEKRDFARTSEPKPKPEAKSTSKSKSKSTSTSKPKSKLERDTGLQFVVQKHAARRLHYDLRLELDGVLKSWAVTRGPSLVLGEKRLAVETEDHPMQYLEFEGNIPKGEYGGGTMIVWDRGQWTPDGDPHRALKKGHLEFSLAGGRLHGRWHLVRMRRKPGEKREQWLLIKAEDEFARSAGGAEITEEETTSFLSGRTAEELAAQGDVRADHARREQAIAARTRAIPDVSRVRGAHKGLLPVFVEPSLAATSERPPSGSKWVHEIKYDGYRLQARSDGGKVALLTRKKLDWAERFKSIAKALEALPVSSALIDGEAVVEDSTGISSFSALQDELQSGRQDRFRYHAFDLIYCEGFDLTKATLIDRKTLLQEIVGTLPAQSIVRYSEHLAEDGPLMLEHTCRLGLEGIISKRVDQPYRSGRGDHWLKSKCVLRQEFVIVGYVPSTAAPGAVGALLVGYHDRGKLVYAGRVGTGYSGTQARALRNELEKIASARPEFATKLPAGAEKSVRWAQPRLVCEVEFRDWTFDGLIRQSSFKGLRDDRLPEDVVLETPVRKPMGQVAPDPAAGRLTHPERILWEGPGVTKQGLAEFYSEIADWILPHISGRVLSLLRCPSGVSEKCFFAKHVWAGLTDAVERVDVGEREPMLAIHDLAGLIDLVQAGVVEIHPWGSTVDRLLQPDRLIFDLDPGEDVPWSAVIAGALDVRERLERLDLQSYVKTSGGKGLHVVVPIEPRADWDEAKAFTQRFAEAMAKEQPDRYVATMAKRARRGRIFVDYLRNGHGATAVAPYSTRSSPQASVSTPLAWDELSEGIRADHFTIDNLRQRLDFLPADPWADIAKVRQRLKT